MKRWMTLGWALLLSLAALVLAACETEAMRPEYANSSTVYNAQTRGPGGAAAASPRAEELWVVPVDDSASAHVPRAAATKRNIAGLPIPGSPVMAARQNDGRVALMPPQHTDVSATITGYIASVGVTQDFVNPYPQKIEAVYVFPLPENAGINEFLVTIGERHIHGIIRERADAERIYRLAKQQGYVASMMTQEQPNIFTQSVANIEPGKKIDVAVRYFHTLAYQDGWFEWDFPMVIGSQSNDARYPRADERSGRDIALHVTLDAGMPIEDLQSVNHAINEPRAKWVDPNMRTIELAPVDPIPNKDFVLRYKVAGDKINTGMFIQKNEEGTGGWFTAMLIPPDDLKNKPQTGQSLLTDVQLDFGAIKVTDVYPRNIPDLSATKPVIITGRFTGALTAGMGISGRAGDQATRYSLAPESMALENPAIGIVWARARLADLHAEALRDRRDIMQDVKATALAYGLVSEYTSFVMVDATRTTEGDAGKTAVAPAIVPEAGHDIMMQRAGN